jgi:hypothetical protein
VRELAERPLRLIELRAVSGGGEVVQAVQELVVAEAEAFLERARGGDELAPLEVTLCAPEDRLEPRFRRRPFLRIFNVHGDDRA